MRRQTKSIAALFVAPLLVAYGPFAQSSFAQAIPVVQCVSDADCSFHGNCDLAGQCVCDKGHVTHDPSKPCGHEQKVQRTAFLLSFFLGNFGAARFYVGKTATAAGQLVLGATAVLGVVVPVLMLGSGVCLEFFAVDKNSDSLFGCEPFEMLCSCCAGAQLLFLLGLAPGVGSFAWWLTDAVLFGTNKVKDGEGEKLKAW